MDQLAVGALTVLKNGLVAQKALPLVKRVGHRVPSAFYIADILMEMDRQLHFKLLRPARDRGDTKLALALSEAARLKKMMSYLRYLWRASSGSKNPEIHELKSYVTKKSDTDDADTDDDDVEEGKDTQVSGTDKADDDDGEAEVDEEAQDSGTDQADDSDGEEKGDEEAKDVGTNDIGDALSPCDDSSIEADADDGDTTTILPDEVGTLYATSNHEYQSY